MFYKTSKVNGVVCQRQPVTNMMHVVTESSKMEAFPVNAAMREDQLQLRLNTPATISALRGTGSSRRCGKRMRSSTGMRCSRVHAARGLVREVLAEDGENIAVRRKAKIRQYGIAVVRHFLL